MSETETEVNRVHGSRCSRCGAFVSDLDAGFSLAAHGYMHTECGGTWFPRVRTARDLETIQACDVCGLVDHHCRSGACPACNQKIQEVEG